MIVTVTPSPSIDWTVTVDHFELGDVNRAVSSMQEPSGKGVNVSWALHRAGIPTVAIFPAGGHTGRFMTDALGEEGLDYIAVETQADVRTNITLVAPGHSGTKINASGAGVSDQVIRELLEAAQREAAAASMVLTCGSLPPGVPNTFHRDLVRSIAATDAYSVVDASGDPLRLALEAKPNLIKPNVHELAQLTERSIRTLGEVIDAAEMARSMGAGAVLASLGGDGVLLVDDEGALYARADGIPVVNAVGAGDALLAGFVGGGPDRESRLFNAILWASSAVAHNFTLFPVRPEFGSLITLGVVAEQDLERQLTEPSAALVSLAPVSHRTATSSKDIS